MKMFKGYLLPIFSAVVLCLVALLCGCKPSSTTGTKQTVETAAVVAEEAGADAEKATSRDVFVQTASAAIVKKLGSQGYYVLTLYRVNPYVTYYAKRPGVESGVLSVQELMDQWKTGDDSFYRYHPNILINAAQIDGLLNKNTTFYLATCSTPQYDMAKGVLSYVIKPLPNYPFVFDHIRLDHVTIVLDAN